MSLQGDNIFPIKNKVDEPTVNKNEEKKEHEEEKEEYMQGRYKLGKTIGEGTFGKVKLGIHKYTGEKVNNKYINIYIFIGGH